jgi:microcompartment protein CcmK/EutM
MQVDIETNARERACHHDELGMGSARFVSLVGLSSRRGRHRASYRNKPVPLGVLDVIDAISLAGVLSLDGKSDRSRFGIAPQGRLPDLKYLNSGI